jgi:hypothetical protein
MPTLRLTNHRTATVCASLLDLPVERLLAYKQALSPEASIEAADELRYQQQYQQPLVTDELSQLAFAASLTVFEASPQARAFTVLVTHIEGQPITDFSTLALRERLSWLLACGLRDEQVQDLVHHHAQELRTLLTPFYQTPSATQQREVEVFEQCRRRGIALCDHVLEAGLPELRRSPEVVQALFDMLEPSTDAPEHATLCPSIRQRAFDQLSNLMLRNPRSCYVTKRLPASLSLSFFLDNARHLIQQLPA